MKKLLFSLAFVLFSCMSVYSQATSLTVDCQTPGWLSSKIDFSDQLTLKSLTVTGYLNGTDLQFIADLNKNRSLKVVNLKNASLVQIAGEDDRYSRYYLRGGYFQKIILPKSLKSLHHYYSSDPVNGDSLIWTSSYVKEIDVESDLGKFLYTYISEGVEIIGGMSDRPKNSRITLPNSINTVLGSHSTKDLIIYSFIENPESVDAFYDTYTSSQGTKYWSSVNNSIFYIPKGTLEKYLRSDFATQLNTEIGNNYGVNNGNRFIEYYDIDRVEIESPIKIYKGETYPLNVTIYPDANLVSWIDYVSGDTEIVSVNTDGTIVANDYGQTEVFATPHVFIDGLETKTGSCIVKVLAHVEGIDMPETLSLHVDEKKNIDAKTLPLDITDNQLIFESSDPTIADVNEDGVVTGHKLGTCTITATSVDGGFTATCEVTVVSGSPATSISLAESDDKITFQVYDMNGTKRTSPQRGVNIIRFADGTMKKMLIK